MTRGLGVVVVAALVVLAGCAGAGGSATSPTTSGTAATDATGGADASGTTDTSGTADTSGDSGDSSTDTSGTADTSGGTDAPASMDPATAGGSGTGSIDFYISDERNDIDDFDHLNVTVTRVGFKEKGDNWTEHSVDNETVDLTRLKGANATQIANLSVENGTYTKTFIYVSEVEGTLTDGSDQRVKLPSGKIQLNGNFTVGENESVDFVFDITVHKAGKSGKYVLRPVATESGTNVPIEEQSATADDGENETENETDPALNATLSGNVTPGGNATVTVTSEGDPVENATVAVNGDEVGTTDANGTLDFTVPEEDTLTVTVTDGDREITLEREFGTESQSQSQSASEGKSNGKSDDKSNAGGNGKG